jgi:uncharacterized phage protein (TIGR02218 family)
MSLGIIHLFEGLATDVKLDGLKIELTISTDAIRLDTKIPAILYQPTCGHTLYDNQCKAVKADFTENNSALTGSSRDNIVFSTVNGDGFFAMGMLTFTTGLNTGLSRTVKYHTAGEMRLAKAFPFDIAVGDEFTVIAGCDKSRYSCENKFLNGTQFLGFEYMPVPEATV